mmetsp:Transcript_115120/g.229274  ORF Transcript_115120/g.229274 Transcript_115120/m.229274 type:complete len:526 (+) Transcript_115120:130-1707(+)
MILSTIWSSPTLGIGAGIEPRMTSNTTYSMKVIDAATSSCSTFTCAMGYEHKPEAHGIVCMGAGSNSSCNLLRCCSALGNSAGIPGNDVQAAAGEIWLAVAGGFAGFACMLATAACGTWFVQRQMLLRKSKGTIAGATVQEEMPIDGRTAPVTLVGSSNDLATETSDRQPVRNDARLTLHDDTVRATLQSINACSSALLAVASSVPQGAAAIEVVPHARQRCLTHRSLKPFVVPWSSGNFRCVQCGRDLSEGQAMWSCRDCNAGLCSGCGARSELLPSCPSGHNLSVLRGGGARGHHGVAACRVCRKQNLAQSNVEFLHCSVCNFNACIECASREPWRSGRRSRRAQQSSEPRLDMPLSRRAPIAEDVEDVSRLSPPPSQFGGLATEEMDSVTSLSMTLAVRPPPGPAPIELGAACNAPQLSDSLAAESVGCQIFGGHRDQLYRESSSGSNMDWALATLDAKAAQIASLLRQVEGVSPREKRKILEYIERLENSYEYRVATDIVRNGSPTPSVVRFDPLGGVMLH